MALRSGNTSSGGNAPQTLEVALLLKPEERHGKVREQTNVLTVGVFLERAEGRTSGIRRIFEPREGKWQRGCVNQTAGVPDFQEAGT